jgi:hypothetical protein
MAKIAMLAAVILLAGGIAQCAPIKGVVVRSCEWNKEQGRYVLQLANVSHQYVVYVSVMLNEHSGAGSYYAPPGEFRPELEFNERLEGTSLHRPRPGIGKMFAPDTTEDLLPGIDASSQCAPVVDVVVYADDTAEVTNEQAFKHYILPIEEEVLTLKKEIEILAQFRGSPNRVADTVAELLRLASEQPDPQIRHDEEVHANPNVLLSVVRELKQGRRNPQTGEHEEVDPETIIKENTEMIELEEPHLHIKRI